MAAMQLVVLGIHAEAKAASLPIGALVAAGAAVELVGR
mgnify:CR=1 FL=1